MYNGSLKIEKLLSKSIICVSKITLRRKGRDLNEIKKMHVRLIDFLSDCFIMDYYL